MAKLEKVLVVGGGIAGMSATIELRKRNIEVDLIDIDPDWKVYGAGISITGPTMRAFKRIGMLEEFKKYGASSEDMILHSMDGAMIQRLKTHPIEDGLPHNGGILRPILHQILSDQVKAAGTKVGLGYTVDSIEQTEDKVFIKFTNGTEGEYDLVVGADGFGSRMRDLVFPDAPEPEFTGQCCWRINATRPDDMMSSEMYFGHTKCGIVPTSPEDVYLFALEPFEKKEWLDDKELPGRLSKLLQGFGGRAGEIRDGINEDSFITFRPLEALLLPRPWSVGRVILIGDAVHATTPHLASGAGIAIEDAIVLGLELDQHDDVIAALQAHEDRRYERCRMVVENSVEIGAMELRHAPPQEVGAMMEESARLLSAEI